MSGGPERHAGRIAESARRESASNSGRPPDRHPGQQGRRQMRQMAHPRHRLVMRVRRQSPPAGTPRPTKTRALDGQHVRVFPRLRRQAGTSLRGTCQRRAAPIPFCSDPHIGCAPTKAMPGLPQDGCHLGLDHAFHAAHVGHHLRRSRPGRPSAPPARASRRPAWPAPPDRAPDAASARMPSLTPRAPRARAPSSTAGRRAQTRRSRAPAADKSIASDPPKRPGPRMAIGEISMTRACKTPPWPLRKSRYHLIICFEQNSCGPVEPARMGGMSEKTTEPGRKEEAKAMVGILAKTHFIGADLPGLRRPGSGQRRIKGQKGEGHCFHVMSRLTGDVPMWDALEKEAHGQAAVEDVGLLRGGAADLLRDGQPFPRPGARARPGEVAAGEVRRGGGPRRGQSGHRGDIG